MFSESAEFYDQIYSSFKDYAQEARDVAALLRTAHPACRTILDVACGTGEHARLLAEHYRFAVDGLDLDPAFVRLARSKHPDGRFHQATMLDFHLGEKYDAVLCLFSSIGYAQTLANVRRALTCFREHLADDGVVVVEPWFQPGVLDPTRVQTRTIEAHGLRVVRIGRTEVDGRSSRILFDYEIHERGAIRHAREVHELGLFTTTEMLECFESAGLAATHETPGLTGRGIFIARATSM